MNKKKIPPPPTPAQEPITIKQNVFPHVSESDMMNLSKKIYDRPTDWYKEFYWKEFEKNIRLSTWLFISVFANIVFLIVIFILKLTE